MHLSLYRPKKGNYALMAQIVILGAGLAGISAAYHLEQKGFFDYLLFEKNSDIGGLCGSLEQDGFTFDYTGHLLHINDPYFQQLIASVVGFEHFNTIHRQSFIYSHNRYTDYPYQMHLYGLPTDVIADCIAGYVKRQSRIKNPQNFKTWVLKQFGAGFAKHFFLPYQKKIFAYNLEQITASWTGRFVPNTSLNTIIEGALHRLIEPVGYNAQFFYPKRGGIMFWVKKIAEQHINPIHTNHKVETIDLKEKRIIFANGQIQPFNMLINTIPLDQFLNMIKEPSNRSLTSASSKLICNSVLNFNLGIAHPHISDKHWIYFPEKEYPFYRLGFPHNFSEHMTPKNCSSLYGEVAYINRSHRWKKDILKKAISKTEELLHIDDKEILVKKIVDISHAYVIYDHWREKNILKLLHELETEKIYSIGRYGAWKYCSMQETLLDGKQIVEKLLIKPALSWHIQMPNRQKEITL